MYINIYIYRWFRRGWWRPGRSCPIRVQHSLSIQRTRRIWAVRISRLYSGSCDLSRPSSSQTPKQPLSPSNRGDTSRGNPNNQSIHPFISDMLFYSICTTRHPHTLHSTQYETQAQLISNRIYVIWFNSTDPGGRSPRPGPIRHPPALLSGSRGSRRAALGRPLRQVSTRRERPRSTGIHR